MSCLIQDWSISSITLALKRQAFALCRGNKELCPKPQQDNGTKMDGLTKFIYDPLPARILFGAGRIKVVKGEVERLGGRRALIIASESQRELAGDLALKLGTLYAGTFGNVVQHVPYQTVEAAVHEVDRLGSDVVIALGGGSAIGLAKGIALQRGLPILAIPTTYAGSEATHIWGISRDGRKTTGRNPVVKPKTVIYDPQLLVTLPSQLSLTSGINAMAHAVEALYAADANPITSLMAAESIRLLESSLPHVVREPRDVRYRAVTLYGCWLAATVLDQVGMALHHKLCHTLGGSFNMPHAAMHTVILPYAMAYNQPYAQEAMTIVGRALDCDPENAPSIVRELSRANGGPTSLKALGLKAEDLERAADVATQNPYYNPRPITRDGILNLLEHAYRGEVIRPGQF